MGAVTDMMALLPRLAEFEEFDIYDVRGISELDHIPMTALVKQGYIRQVGTRFHQDRHRRVRTYAVIPDAPKPAEAPRTKVQRILAILEEHPEGLLTSEIEKRLGDSRKSSDLLASMLRKGLVTKLHVRALPLKAKYKQNTPVTQTRWFKA